MASLKAEIDRNFKTFSASWISDQQESINSLSAETARYRQSYRRLTTLQAWRSYVLERHLSDDVIGFFLEAQNDALISHVNARMGGWRIALKSLRSLIENSLRTLYYMDHAVEHQLWSVGRHRVDFRDLTRYLTDHPACEDKKLAETSIATIKKEYRELSNAVHSASKGFRMTAAGKAISLWAGDKAKIGHWVTRERSTLLSINLLYVVLLGQHLQGSANPQVRQALSFSIPRNKDSQIKKQLGVTIKRD